MSKPRLIIPDHIKPYIVAQHCDDFPIERYYKNKQVDQIIESIEDTRRTAAEMNKLGINYMNSTLLYSVPGTGKTTLGKYIAYVFDKDFIYLDFAKLFSGSTGTVTAILADIFDFAQESDCIFMIDEIDCISPKRGMDNQSLSIDKNLLTAVIMQQLDKMRSEKTKCIILGATNRREIMDDALFSRFSVAVELRPLNNQEKEEYILKYLGNVNYEYQGKKGIPYDIKNIREYCAATTSIRQRNVESDMNRCIALWVKNGKRNFYLEHIREQAWKSTTHHLT